MQIYQVGYSIFALAQIEFLIGCLRKRHLWGGRRAFDIEPTQIWNSDLEPIWWVQWGIDPPTLWMPNVLSTPGLVPGLAIRLCHIRLECHRVDCHSSLWHTLLETEGHHWSPGSVLYLAKIAPLAPLRGGGAVREEAKRKGMLRLQLQLQQKLNANCRQG